MLYKWNQAVGIILGLAFFSLSIIPVAVFIICLFFFFLVQNSIPWYGCIRLSNY